MIYLTLFFEFFKTGLFAIGGGMATVPFLMDLTTRYDWFTKSELANMIAISESTPGPIGINMATFAGYRAGGGLFTAIAATLSLVLPAVIIIIIIAKFMQNFSDNKIVKAVFYGIRPVIASLILYAVWQIAVITFFNTDGSRIEIYYIPLLICATLFVLLQSKKFRRIHPLVWIVAGAVLGIVFQL
ncbi:MAG: chromate transporter [Hespellia sp.]|nr:chromate transporter [Hespellia sp.]